MSISRVQHPGGRTVEFYGRNSHRDASRYARRHGLPLPAYGPGYRAGRRPGSKNRKSRANDTGTIEINGVQLEPVRTYEDIAAELGVSWQRVQQIEQSALRKIRALLAVKGIYSIGDLV